MSLPRPANTHQRHRAICAGSTGTARDRLPPAPAGVPPANGFRSPVLNLPLPSSLFAINQKYGSKNSTNKRTPSKQAQGSLLLPQVRLSGRAVGVSGDGYRLGRPNLMSIRTAQSAAQLRKRYSRSVQRFSRSLFLLAFSPPHPSVTKLKN